MTQTVNQNDTNLFDAVAELGKLLGMNKSASLALAILYTADKPLSLDEITTSTGIAKSSNSVILKNLEQMGLVETVDVPHERRKFFKIVDNPGESFAMLIARRIDIVTTRSHGILAIDDTEHSAQFASRISQLKTIYKALLQTAQYLRDQRSEVWEDICTQF